MSRNTVRKAIRILAADGLIRTSRGRNGGSVVELPAVPPPGRREIAAAWRPNRDRGADQLASPDAFGGFACEHTPIMRAIGNGDAEQASVAMAAHLQQAREQFAQLLDKILVTARAPAMSQR